MTIGLKFLSLFFIKICLLLVDCSLLKNLELDCKTFSKSCSDEEDIMLQVEAPETHSSSLSYKGGIHHYNKEYLLLSIHHLALNMPSLA
jgi:hypothetical protein